MPAEKPGPLCISELGANWIDSGTAVLLKSHAPVPAGSVVGGLLSERQKSLAFPAMSVLATGPAVASKEQELADKWLSKAASVKFNIQPHAGVIFCKVDQDRAKSLALRNNPMAKVIRDLLDSGFRNEYEKAFGSTENALTYRIWEQLSKNYALSLSGKVTAYVSVSRTEFADANMQRIKLDSIAVEHDKDLALGEGSGAGPEVEKGYATNANYKPPSILITEVEEMMGSNPNVSTIVFKTDAGKEWIYQRSVRSTMTN